MAVPGEKIGHIRVVEFLGRGGMGDVYVGIDERLGRRVALKTIRSEHRLNAEAKARFLREARILSQLDHPHICRIYDLVEEPDADLLVLELIQGKSLGEAIRRGLSSTARMRIALQLVQALAVAHGKGVVHRDLKPDNVLVDAHGDIKILDFGLARSLADTNAPTLALGEQASGEEPVPEYDDDLASATTDVRTRIGSVMGTLGYMSPEQARGEPSTPASDVYSCGLLLQELFTGRPPYDTALDRRSLLQKARDGETLPITGIDPDLAALIRRLQSLAPAARPSAVDVVERLRWIQDKPRRRRRRWLVAASMVLLASIAAVMAVQTVRVQREAARANREAEAAHQVSQFLVGLFKVSNPGEARGSSVTAREILERGAARVRRELDGQPLVQARLMDTMGRVYDSLGLYDEARPLLGDALATRRRLLGQEHLDVAATLDALGGVWWHEGEYGNARPLLEQGLAIRERQLGSNDPLVASSAHNLGNLCWSAGDYDSAQRLVERALAIREKALGPHHPDVASTLNSLGAIAYRKGDLAATRPLWERTLSIRERTLGPDHPLLAQTLNNLAVVHTDTGDPKGARALLERVVTIQEKVLGSSHPDLASSLSNLGEALLASGDRTRAREALERAVRMLEAANPEHPELARFLARLGQVRLAGGEVTEARRLYRRSLSIRETVFGSDHVELVESLVGLANCDRQEGRFERAEAAFERALALARKPDGGYSPLMAPALEDYAALLRATRREARAAELESLSRSLVESR